MSVVTDYDVFTVVEYYKPGDVYGIRELDDEITDVERKMGEVQCQEWINSNTPINTTFLFSEDTTEEECNKMMENWHSKNLDEYDIHDQYFVAKFPVVITEEIR